MSEASLSPPAGNSTPALPRDLIAQRAEEALARLREARPHLEERIGRAAQLVVVQISSPPGTRPIRCRIRKGGRPVMLVSSLSSAGVVYQVDPRDWSCSCPDFHRSEARACKHGAACYVLWRASLAVEVGEHVDRVGKIDDRTKKSNEEACADCGEAFPRDRLIEVGEGQAEEALNSGELVCRICAPRHGLSVPRSRHEPTHDDEGEEDGMPQDGLTYAQVEEWLKDQRWQVAKTMPDNPHSYALKRNAADPAMFDAVVRFIQERGDIYRWWGADYRQLVANRHAHWSMSGPGRAVLINRKDLEQVRRDELRNKGGGGIQWRWLHGDVEEDRAALRREESGQDELGERA